MSVPTGAASLPCTAPGPGLAALLGSLTLADLGDDHVIDVLVATQRLASWVSSLQRAAMAELARRRPADPLAAAQGRDPGVDEDAAAEIACALRIPAVRAARDLQAARSIARRLPAVLDALSTGRITDEQADVLDQETSHLPQADAAAIAATLVPGADRWTAAQLRGRAHRRALAVRPRETEDNRRVRARADHDVRTWPVPDGLGNACLYAVLAPGDAAVAYSIIDTAAWNTKQAGDERPIGELRAATLIDLVLGRTVPAADDAGADAAVPVALGPADGAGGAGSSGSGVTGARTSHRRRGIRGAVNVTIPLGEFTKLAAGRLQDDSSAACPPGSIEGLGSFPAWVVRDLVDDLTAQPGITYRATVFDPETGELIARSSDRYVPPERLRAHINARDVTCRFPGCNARAARCDVDHVVPWQLGGDTSECNLHCLCRRHHRMKQRAGWRVRHQAGVSEWTTRTGHTYTTSPHDYRDPGPPPDHRDPASLPDEVPPSDPGPPPDDA